VPYISLVKLEYPATTITEVEKACNVFHKKNIKVLAEKVETESDFKICYEAGCDLFQGYFFAKPETIGETKIEADIVSTFEIIKELNSDSEIERVEGMFKSHPQLSVNLIKYLNSAAFATRSQITSIRHAISLLGYNNLKRWLLILAYASRSDMSKKSPLISSALYRATFFENIARVINLEKSEVEKSYLMGLVSNLSAIYKIPMDVMLSQISLDTEINEALLRKAGKLGTILELDQCIERDDAKGTERITKELKIPMEELNSCVLKSYEASQEAEDKL
jgi:EAL and modified HD-GYP domain-containing signal transduction protein